MTVEVDLERRTVTASVRALVETAGTERRGGGLLARARAELGNEVHRRYREQRAREFTGFRAEVSTALTQTIDGFALQLTGRADGLIEEDARSVVEEVKSIELGAAHLSRAQIDDFPEWAAQARLYALCLSRQPPTPPLAARLVLVSIVDGAQRVLEVPFEPGVALRELTRRVRQAVAEARRRRAYVEERSAVGERLRFPYPAERRHQATLVTDLHTALDAGRPVLACAPTGIGKTVCAMLTGLRFALARGGTLLYLTAKTTQQELAAHTFEDLVAATDLETGELSAVTLRAKERMCPPGTMQCHPDLCPLLAAALERSVLDEVAEVVRTLQPHLDPDLVYIQAEAAGLCPFELSLALAARVDLVIGDYNYVYDPGVALSRLLDAPGAHPAVVVVDEAHNLFDRARGYFSPFFSRADLLDLAGKVEAGEYLAPDDRGGQRSLAGITAPVDGRELSAGLAAICRDLLNIMDASLHRAVDAELEWIEGSRPEAADLAAWDRLAAAAARHAVQLALYDRVHRLARPRDPLVTLLRDVVRARDLLSAEEPELIHYVSGPRSPHGRGVGVLCVDPARQLERRHRRVAGTIAMSATLSPLPYFSDVLGFSGLHPALTSVPSPFPEEHHCAVVVPTVRTTLRDRHRSYEDIARLIGDVFTARAGRYIAFFSSFAFLAEVRARIALPADQMLVQLPAMPASQRAKMLDTFRAGPPPRLLLAVTGGSFGEGIDLPGEELVGAIVVGPSLPPVGFERAIMRSHFDDRGGQGFAYAMLYPGMQRVVQAAGRVIRSMEDRGVVVLAGRRFAEPAYLDSIPPHWYRHRPEELITDSPFEVLEAFWRSTSRSP